MGDHMKKHIRRLTFALVISTTCFMATVAWFHSGKDTSKSTLKSPVARLNENINEVQRKPVKRVIWENISNNDDLFAGEAVRTSAASEAKIVLLKTGATIHLEPDSLVVLEENDKGLSLDFLAGNLFVQGGGENLGDGLTLKTGGGEIKINSADMSLSKDRSGKINLEVHRGSAQLQQGSQTVSIDKDKAAVLSASGLSVDKDRIQILSPKAGETVLLMPSRGEKINLSWQPLPAGYVVEAEVGATRSNLRKLGLSSPGDKNTLAFSQKPGKWFLRLTARSADPNQPQLASSVIPFTVDSKNPPFLIEPLKEASVLKGSPEEPVLFRWVKKHSFQSQVVEVASDPSFKSVIHKKVVDSLTEKVDFPVVDGSYHWRVTGFLKIGEKLEPLSSPAASFTVNSKWEIQPPIPVYPTAGMRLSFLDVQKRGVNFKWKAPPGVKRFQISLHKKAADGLKPIHDQHVNATFTKLSDLVPGQYVWKIASHHEGSGQTKSTEPIEFSIDELARLEWADNLKEEYEFSTPAPSLAAQWKPLMGPYTYRYRVTPEGQAPDANGWKSTKQNFFETAVAEEGRFVAVVEALNGQGLTVSATDAKIFQVKRKPLLPPPIWASETPPVVKADAKGNLSLGWQPVDGATSYLMVLQTPEGEVIEERPITRNLASINRMKPGEYKVQLKSVDGLKRAGPGGEAKIIQVPDTSDIRAPKIKKMKVK